MVSVSFVLMDDNIWYRNLSGCLEPFENVGSKVNERLKIYRRENNWIINSGHNRELKKAPSTDNAIATTTLKSGMQKSTWLSLTVWKIFRMVNIRQSSAHAQANIVRYGLGRCGSSTLGVAETAM